MIRFHFWYYYGVIRLTAPIAPLNTVKRASPFVASILGGPINAPNILGRAYLTSQCQRKWKIYLMCLLIFSWFRTIPDDSIGIGRFRMVPVEVNKPTLWNWFRNLIKSSGPISGFFHILSKSSINQSSHSQCQTCHYRCSAKLEDECI